jgi:nicotinamide-nucleotide amidase
MRRLLVVGDDGRQIQNEVERATEDSEIVIVTGGLGPTADDRTREALACATGRELTEDRESLQHIRELLRKHGVELSESHRRQALFPEGAEIFDNPRGTARGFACTVGNSTLVAMPGVPMEMHAMFRQSVLPHLLDRVKECVAIRKVHVFGVPESEVDRRLTDVMDRGRNPSVGLTVQEGTVTVCLRARAEDDEAAARLLDADQAVVRERCGDSVYGVSEGADRFPLARAVSDLLKESGNTIAVAESCTGGEIGSLLVDIPGISRFFLLDVVAYSNGAKMDLLDVPSEQIESVGAVSAEVAVSMARGVCEAAGADVGVSTTGIAGPTGGTEEKPVGLVHVGVCLHGRCRSHRLELKGDRWRVKDRAAKHALNFARLALLHEGYIEN